MLTSIRDVRKFLWKQLTEKLAPSGFEQYLARGPDWFKLKFDDESTIIVAVSSGGKYGEFWLNPFFKLENFKLRDFLGWESPASST